MRFKSRITSFVRNGKSRRVRVGINKISAGDMFVNRFDRSLKIEIRASKSGKISIVGLPRPYMRINGTMAKTRKKLYRIRGKKIFSESLALAFLNYHAEWKRADLLNGGLTRVIA